MVISLLRSNLSSAMLGGAVSQWSKLRGADGVFDVTAILTFLQQGRSYWNRWHIPSSSLLSETSPVSFVCWCPFCRCHRSFPKFIHEAAVSKSNKCSSVAKSYTCHSHKMSQLTGETMYCTELCLILWKTLNGRRAHTRCSGTRTRQLNSFPLLPPDWLFASIKPSGIRYKVNFMVEKPESIIREMKSIYSSPFLFCPQSENYISCYCTISSRRRLFCLRWL